MNPSLKEKYRLEKERLRKGQRNGLRFLPAREKEVLELRLGLDGSPPLTLEEVGRRFGLTKQRVSQIERSALRKLIKARNHKTPLPN